MPVVNPALLVRQLRLQVIIEKLLNLNSMIRIRLLPRYLAHKLLRFQNRRQIPDSKQIRECRLTQDNKQIQGHLIRRRIQNMKRRKKEHHDALQ